MQNGLKNSTPVKVVFSDVSADGTSQTYQYALDAKGACSAAAPSSQVENNTLSLTIPLEDRRVRRSAPAPATAVHRNLDMTVAGSPTKARRSTSRSASQVRWTIVTARRGGLADRATVDTGSASKGISLSDAYRKTGRGCRRQGGSRQLDSAATPAILANAKRHVTRFRVSTSMRRLAIWSSISSTTRPLRRSSGCARNLQHTDRTVFKES